MRSDERGHRIRAWRDRIAPAAAGARPEALGRLGELVLEGVSG